VIPCNSGRGDCRLPKKEIIRKREDFKEILQKGSRINGTALRFIMTKSRERQVGFIVPKRIIRKAVDRNKLKRWLREIYRQSHSLPVGGRLLIMIRRRPENYSSLHAEFEVLVNRTQLNI